VTLQLLGELDPEEVNGHISQTFARRVTAFAEFAAQFISCHVNFSL
jgi:hypothetical protein